MIALCWLSENAFEEEKQKIMIWEKNINNNNGNKEDHQDGDEQK